MSSTPEMLNDRPDRTKRKNLVPWLVTVLVAFCLVVMNTRGIASTDSQVVWDATTTSFEQSRSYDHGWPWTWMKSESAGSPSGIAFASQTLVRAGYKNSEPDDGETAWPFVAKKISVRWNSFGCNVLMATLLLILVFVATRFRWGRKRRLSFSLLDIGICVVMVSFFFANYQYHRTVAKHESATLLSNQRVEVLNDKWCGPNWLRLLVSEQDWMNNYRHASHLQVNLLNFDGDLTEMRARFPFVDELEILGDLNLTQIESLSEFRHLNRIHLKSQILSRMSTFNSGRGLGFYDSAQQMIRRRREHKIEEVGESHQSRIEKADVQLRGLVELEIDSRLDAKNNWPRALDLVSCCPYLKKVSLHGKQFLVEDLMNLPSGIEEIEFGWQASLEDSVKLKKQFPNATIQVGPKAMSMIDQQSIRWQHAENRVNRRRTNGWVGAQFSYGILDLSLTELDKPFLETLRPIFADVHLAIFGSFDSPATAIWLARQCTRLRNIDAGDYRFEFSDVMKLPANVDVLALEQGSISAEEILILIQHLKLRKLTLRSTTFNSEEIETIRSATQSCVVEFE